MTLYAIGDIHGHLDKLKAAHDLVAQDRAREGAEDAPLIHVGDLVDRGPDSAGVIAYLLALRDSDPRVQVLRGNHDQMLLSFLQGKLEAVGSSGSSIAYLDDRIGGRTTLASYGLRRRAREAALAEDAPKTVPPEHIAFLDSLPHYAEVGECLFVHAGIRPGIPLAEQDKQDLIWIRNDFLWDTRDHGPLVVHGHTPAERVEHWGNRLNLDTGAGFGRPLSAVAIEGREAFLLTPNGRQKVV